jgi:DNA polymerase III subunit gamma/tau
MEKTLPLHLKYRPEKLGQMIGNESTIQSLESVLLREKGQVRAFLFSGPSGCGKTTIARIIAKELKCSDRDFYEYNSANLRGIDSMREIINSIKYAPLNGKIKVYLLDEFHQATKDAQNALLKLLEDTPEHVVFILCTTEPEKIIKTIKTRCTHFPVTRLQKAKIINLLKEITKKEKIEMEDKIFQKIAEVCDGSPRQALVILDQIIDIPDDESAFMAIQNMTVNETSVLELAQALLQKSKWATVSKILKEIDGEPEKIRYAILNYMSMVLLSKDSPRASIIMDVFLESWMYSGKAGMIQACYICANL